MATEREIALEQALIAVLGAVQDLELGVEQVTQKANGLVIGHSKYRQVEHPGVTQACQEIGQALEVVKAKA
ncbi:hypothetical protein ACX3YG_14450 [Pseudomonas wadenswilerensis]